jgi:hypothetical protein
MDVVQSKTPNVTPGRVCAEGFGFIRKIDWLQLLLFLLALLCFTAAALLWAHSG